MLSNRLVIGLDYGTTYTGVSFCETSDTSVLEKHIEVIKDWPLRHTKIGTKEKVPSEIAYLPEGAQWGGLIPPNVQRHMWTKLKLDRPQVGEAARIFKELTLSDRPTKKKPVEIVADFLRHIKGHVVKNLDDQYGEELWKTLPITLVVTVPAVWSDGAKDRTMQAVYQAGFNEIQFPKLKRVVTATEPEAAAIYTIKSLSGSVQDDQFKVGDGLVVCDMGGGTVDLISYRIVDLSPTILEEATIGSGDLCGGSFVDLAFIRWLERQLGTSDFIKIAGTRSDNIPRTSMSIKLSRMVQDFCLEVKSGFSGTETNFLRLPSPLSAIEDDPLRGIVDGELTIKPADMEEMFEFALRRTYELLLGQFQSARTNGSGIQLKYVLMVGGFSESPYVYTKIKTFAEANGLQVIRPAFAWSAVVRGAAAKGLEGDGRTAIRNRKSRRSYGTSTCPVFVANKHREADAYICRFDGIKRARRQASWLIKKGQNLSTSVDSHAKPRLHTHVYVGEDRTAEIDLIASDLDSPPRSSVHESVHQVATITVDLNRVPADKYTLCFDPRGKPYHSLGFDLKLSVQSPLQYSLSVDGEEYGSVIAKYT